MPLLFIISILLTLLFFSGGIFKLMDLNAVTKDFVTKTQLPFFLAKIILVAVILLELIAPVIIAVYSYHPTPLLYYYTKISIISLILFTIAATLLYHFPPHGSNYYSFMSNISTIGGLMLLLQCSKV
jgi:uncharacterized membrane protein YphA (DoxX/SURF4 family)